MLNLAGRLYLEPRPGQREIAISCGNQDTAAVGFPGIEIEGAAHCSRDLVMIDFSDADKKESPQEDDS